MLTAGDIIGIITLLMWPLTIFGTFYTFKRIMRSREVQEWITLIKEFKKTAKDLLEKYENEHPTNTQ